MTRITWVTISAAALVAGAMTLLLLRAGSHPSHAGRVGGVAVTRDIATPRPPGVVGNGQVRQAARAARPFLPLSPPEPSEETAADSRVGELTRAFEADGDVSQTDVQARASAALKAALPPGGAISSLTCRRTLCRVVLALPHAGALMAMVHDGLAKASDDSLWRSGLTFQVTDTLPSGQATVLGFLARE